MQKCLETHFILVLFYLSPKYNLIIFIIIIFKFFIVCVFTFLSLMLLKPNKEKLTRRVYYREVFYIEE